MYKITNCTLSVITIIVNKETVFLYPHSSVVVDNLTEQIKNLEKLGIVKVGRI